MPNGSPPPVIEGGEKIAQWLDERADAIEAKAPGDRFARLRAWTLRDAAEDLRDA